MTWNVKVTVVYPVDALLEFSLDGAALGNANATAGNTVEFTFTGIGQGEHVLGVQARVDDAVSPETTIVQNFLPPPVFNTVVTTFNG